MAEKHPYTPSGPGGISAAIVQLRKSFPKTVDAETLKKLSIAPSNESYIINILRFIGAIDSNGNKTEIAAAVFSKSDDDFKMDFGVMLKKTYSDLFELHQEEAWTLPSNRLQSYFRSTDQTSEIVGKHQANTFLALAALAGHGEVIAAPAMRNSTKSKLAKVPKTGPPRSRPDDSQAPPVPSSRDSGLTVRIEVNLPPQGDQDTYDKIFRSIRENLLPNAK
jgi:hypothetical protein